MPPDLLGEVWSRSQAYIPYGEALGQPQLRQAWMSYYRRFGVQLKDDEILITAGASEAILFTMMAIADPGEEVIVPEPFYANYNGFAISVPKEEQTLDSTEIIDWLLEKRSKTKQ